MARLFKWKLASSPQLLFEIFSRFLNGHLNSPTGRNVQHLVQCSLAVFVLLFPFNLLFHCTVCSHNYGLFDAECLKCGWMERTGRTGKRTGRGKLRRKDAYICRWSFAIHIARAKGMTESFTAAAVAAATQYQMLPVTIFEGRYDLANSNCSTCAQTFDCVLLRLLLLLLLLLLQGHLI